MVSRVVLATKIAKGNRTLGKSAAFSEYHKPKQLAIHVVTQRS